MSDLLTNVADRCGAALAACRTVVGTDCWQWVLAMGLIGGKKSALPRVPGAVREVLGLKQPGDAESRFVICCFGSACAGDRCQIGTARRFTNCIVRRVDQFGSTATAQIQGGGGGRAQRWPGPS